MRRWIFIGLAAAAIGATSRAHAADLAPAPPPAAPPAFNWAGFYLGGFAGGSLAGSSQGYSVSSAYLTANLPSLIPFVNSAGSQSLSANGVDLGIEAGYNWNVANAFVLGVAGDVSWGNLNGGRATSGILPIVQLPYAINQQLSADWRGSLRLRAGVTPLDNLLVYATGGPAFGHFTYQASYWDQLLPPFAPGNETEASSFQAIRMGWTLGTGAEWALSHNWSLTGEYRHSEYGALGGTGVLQLQQPASTAYLGHSSGAIHVDSLRLGVNYHFD